MSRIIQAVAKITYLNNSHRWVRISRRTPDSFENWVRVQPNFYYSKIYTITNYHRLNTKRGIKHSIGEQIGFVTLNGSKFWNLGQ